MLFGKKRVYLDWAASAPVLPIAAHVYERALRAFGNPSSVHAEGRAAKEILETARVRIARELEVKTDDVIFTSGATEANNIAIQGAVVAAHKRGVASPHVLYLPSAHASVVETVRAVTAYGAAADPLPIENGAVSTSKLKGLIRPETVLVCMDFVCGETGTVWNTREVKHELPEGVVFHVDATQAPYEESCERTRIGADTLALDAQKIGGIRGMGVLIAPRATALEPVMQGGGQERGLRSGTPSPALAAAFAEALVAAGKNREAFAARASKQRTKLISHISGIKDLTVNQGKKGRASILNISLIDRDTDYLAALLNEAGFAVSTKSACESDSARGSRAVLALTNDAERAQTTLRISWGTESDRDLERFAEALVEAVEFLDRNRA
jgi:cysteine desulfurase